MVVVFVWSASTSLCWSADVVSVLQSHEAEVVLFFVPKYLVIPWLQLQFWHPQQLLRLVVNAVYFNISKSKPFAERTLKREKCGAFFERQYEMS